MSIPSPVTTDSPLKAVELPAVMRIGSGALPGGFLRTGVPWPRGVLKSPHVMLVPQGGGEPISCQSRVLTTWSDGSIQWLEVIGPSGNDPTHSSWQLQPVDGMELPASTAPVLQIADVEQPSDHRADGSELETCILAPMADPQQLTGMFLAECGEFRCSMAGRNAWFVTASPDQQTQSLSALFTLTDERGGERNPVVSASHVTRSGPHQATLSSSGFFEGLDIGWETELDLFAGSNLLRISLTLKNPRRAKHPDGYWDLGDPGSFLFGGCELKVMLTPGAVQEIAWQTQRDRPIESSSRRAWRLVQESSGGENWNSINHVNRRGQVPLRFRGYRLKCGEEMSAGERASPVVAVKSAVNSVACTVDEFWQKFPTAIEATDSGLTIGLLPTAAADLHELQAGEHFTRVVWLDVSADSAAALKRLADLHEPAVVAPTAETIHRSGVVWQFPDPQTEDRAELQRIRAAALTGPRNFFLKRETADEYGWRNFGDMWADHEGAYAEDPAPVVSHYNNQYDLLHSLLVEGLRTGDERWWRLADPLARHVMDCDIYHTTRDKPAYNGGLFWHTAHYHAVGRATHRCMSTTMRNRKIPAPGAGPCNEHNYSTGLLLYHCLTGSPQARACVLGMADWTIAMDDGSRHVLGVASSQSTGLASSTCEAGYHGPGRGAGNSITSLLNGWLLSHDRCYLDKARELVQRCIHPHDDLPAQGLDNAELRWSYTVFLQAILRLEESLAATAADPRLQDYIRAAVRHYARWMAEHERFYLDEPAKLEYPTETWAAQELRKGTVLLLASRYGNADEAARWRSRGRAMLDRAWQSLLGFDSFDYARPLAVVLQQGYLETASRNASTVDERDRSSAVENSDWGSPAQFISQKAVVRQSLRSPAKWPRVMGHMLRPAAWYQAARQTWLAERVRRLLGVRG